MPAFWKTGPAASAESEVGVAEAGHDLVLLDELLRGLRSDVHLVLAVVDDEVDRLAEDTAVGVYLFDGKLGAVRSREAEARTRRR